VCQRFSYDLLIDLKPICEIINSSSAQVKGKISSAINIHVAKKREIMILVPWKSPNIEKNVERRNTNNFIKGIVKKEICLSLLNQWSHTLIVS
jgi:hypothetical protein